MINDCFENTSPAVLPLGPLCLGMPPASTKAKGFHVPAQNDVSLPCHALIPTSAVLEPRDHRRSLKMPSISIGRHDALVLGRHEAAQRAHTDDGEESQLGDAAAAHPERSTVSGVS